MLINAGDGCLAVPDTESHIIPPTAPSFPTHLERHEAYYDVMLLSSSCPAKPGTHTVHTLPSSFARLPS